jgi:hypothetical protein
MFCSKRTSTLALRASGALALARSFLLLEDDYAVDWEVDVDEPAAEQHPHRVPLRPRESSRRPGAPPAVSHVCISPVRGGAARRRGEGSATPRAARSGRGR